MPLLLRVPVPRAILRAIASLSDPTVSPSDGDTLDDVASYLLLPTIVEPSRTHVRMAGQVLYVFLRDPLLKSFLFRLQTTSRDELMPFAVA